MMRGQLNDFLMLHNIDDRTVTKVTFERDCVLGDRGYFVTKITVDYIG